MSRVVPSLRDARAHGPDPDPEAHQGTRGAAAPRVASRASHRSFSLFAAFLDTVINKYFSLGFL